MKNIVFIIFLFACSATKNVSNERAIDYHAPMASEYLVPINYAYLGNSVTEGYRHVCMGICYTTNPPQWGNVCTVCGKKIVVKVKDTMPLWKQNEERLLDLIPGEWEIYDSIGYRFMKKIK